MVLKDLKVYPLIIFAFKLLQFITFLTFHLDHLGKYNQITLLKAYKQAQ